MKRQWWKAVKGQDCPVMYVWECRSVPVTRNPHHIRGRAGALLCDSRYWLAVSKRGHQLIHENPERARHLGWLAQKGDWGRQP